MVTAARGRPEPGEDLGELAAAGREPQDQLPGVAGQPARDGDEAAAEGGDHGLAAADAMTGHDRLAGGRGDELVQPAGHAGREQRSSPYPILLYRPS